MRQPILTLFFSFAAVHGLLAQEPLPAEITNLKQTLDAKVTLEVETLRTTIMLPVEQRYLDALTRGLKAVQQSADLKEAQSFTAEIEQLESFKNAPGMRITASVENPPPQFGKIRRIYLAEVAKYEAEVLRRLTPLFKTQYTALVNLSKDYTRKGNLPAAEAAKKEQDIVQLATCHIPDGQSKVLRNGELCYLNRDYVWANVPFYLQDMKFNITTGGVPQSLVVDIVRPGVVYVAILAEQREEAEKQLLSMGFKETPLTFLQTPRGGSGMKVYAKFMIQGFKLAECPKTFSGYIIIANLE